MSGYCTVVTGAAGGIGRAVVARLFAAGEKVVAADLDGALLEKTFAGNPDVCCVACDLATDNGFKLLTNEIRARFGGVKGFVHAAGIDMADCALVRAAGLDHFATRRFDRDGNRRHHVQTLSALGPVPVGTGD